MYPLTPALRRALRRLRRPTLRAEARGFVGIYPDRSADAPIARFDFDTHLGSPLVRAVAVVLGLVALLELIDFLDD